MDARSRRSRAALVDAVYRLAEERGIDELTATEIASVAGVSRDTFYRHAADPIDLLTTALRDELAASLAAFHEMPIDSNGPYSVFLAPAQTVMEHMRKHVVIYRQASHSRASAHLSALIRSAAADVIGTHLERHPEIVPDDLRPLTAATAAMAVAYASAGAAASFEAWLALGDLDDTHRAAQQVLASGPQWWLGETVA